LLLADRFDDPAGARAAWEAVLRLLDEPASRGDPAAVGAASADPAAGELAALFLRLQANAALARLAGAAAGATGE
jgi:hypothetical protein